MLVTYIIYGSLHRLIILSSAFSWQGTKFTKEDVDKIVDKL